MITPFEWLLLRTQIAILNVQIVRLPAGSGDGGPCRHRENALS